MKFCKILNYLIEQTIPEWRDKFLSYKDLKKQLKRIYPDERPNKRPRLRGDEEDVTCFVRLLEGEIDKFNQFYMDQEEEYIIKLEVLQDRVAETMESEEELMTVGRQIVDFHGEMVLLLNYSALNYIGLVKILKKYDKRSGALVQRPFIKKVLQEPFFSTDILNNLVKECERMLNKFFPSRDDVATYQVAEGKEKSSVSGAKPETNFQKVPEELAEIKHVKSLYLQQTMMALEVLTKIRNGSSTVSVFSLPPI